MESPRTFTMRGSVWAVFLLSTVVTSYARVYNTDEVTASLPLEPADLQRAEQEVTDIIMWHGKQDGQDPYEIFNPSYMTRAGCQVTYGFLPCSDEAGVSAVLLLAFGFLLFKAAALISEGIDRSLSLWDLRLPVTPLLMVKTLPALLIIVAIAFARNPEETEVRAEVGIGLLAGTTALMLSLVWGLLVVAGRCDLQSDGVDFDTVHTGGWSLTETGVKILPDKNGLAIFLPLSVVLPYLIAQIAVTVGWSDGFTSVFLPLFFSVLCLRTLMQTDQEQLIGKTKPRVRRALAEAEEALKPSSSAFWLQEDGVTTDDEALRKVFSIFDKDRSGFMSRSELHGFIVALGLGQEARVPGKAVVEKWMKKFDTDDDKVLSVNEFLAGMKNLYMAKPTMKDLLMGSNFQELKLTLSAVVKELKELNEEDRAKATEGNNIRKLKFIALLYFISGVVIAAFVSIPVVDKIQDFSKVTGISPVLVSFVAIPLLLHLPEGLSAASIARKKRRERVTMAFSKIFGKLFRNNFLPLAVFVVILWIKGVKWNFLPEVLLILIAYLAIGIVASVRTSFPLWIGVLALLLYPVFLALEVCFHLYLPKF